MRATLISGVDSLVGLGRCGADIERTLLRALTELYVQKASHTSEEEGQFVELALRLVDAVDAATRAEIARLLAAYPGAPAEIVDRLSGKSVNDLEEDAAPFDRKRPTDPGSDRPPADSENTDDAVAITQRFFAASPEQRAAILTDLGAHSALAPDSPKPTPNTASVLETSALAGRPSDFIRELESALGIGRPLAEAIVNDRSGEPLVVAAKALALPIDVLQRILLFVNPSIGHSVRRVYALSALFDQISSAAAVRLAASWRKAEEAPMRRRSTAAPRAPRSPSAASPPARNAQATPQAQSSGGVASANDPVEKVAS